MMKRSDNLEKQGKDVDAQKALEEKDAKWKAVHGLSRQEHQRFLLASYVDFESNAEFAQFVRMNKLRMKAKKNTEVKN